MSDNIIDSLTPKQLEFVCMVNHYGFADGFDGPGFVVGGKRYETHCVVSIPQRVYSWVSSSVMLREDFQEMLEGHFGTRSSAEILTAVLL